MEPDVLPQLWDVEGFEAEIRSGALVFPSSVGVALRLRRALEDPDLHLNELTRLVSADPVLAASVVRMGNSVAYNRTGQMILDVRSAASRIGAEPVRVLAMALVMRQILGRPSHTRARVLADVLWVHTIEVSAMCFVLARRYSRLNPDSALLIGLVHELGHFYLLARADAYPTLVSESSLERIRQAPENPMTSVILDALGLPVQIRDALCAPRSQTPACPPKGLGDCLWLAHLMAEAKSPFETGTEEPDPEGFDRESMDTLLDEARDEVAMVQAALGTI